MTNFIFFTEILFFFTLYLNPTKCGSFIFSGLLTFPQLMFFTDLAKETVITLWYKFY